VFRAGSCAVRAGAASISKVNIVVGFMTAIIGGGGASPHFLTRDYFVTLKATKLAQTKPLQSISEC
jgi:hypothetical protein